MSSRQDFTLTLFFQHVLCIVCVYNTAPTGGLHANLGARLLLNIASTHFVSHVAHCGSSVTLCHRDEDFPLSWCCWGCTGVTESVPAVMRKGGISRSVQLSNLSLWVQKKGKFRLSINLVKWFDYCSQVWWSTQLCHRLNPTTPTDPRAGAQFNAGFSKTHNV